MLVGMGGGSALLWAGLDLAWGIRVAHTHTELCIFGQRSVKNKSIEFLSLWDSGLWLLVLFSLICFPRTTGQP